MEEFDNYKIFFYILIAILYFLFSGKKKPKQEHKNVPPVREIVQEKPVNVPKPVTTVPPKTGQLVKKEETVRKQAEPEKKFPYSLEDILREFGNTLDDRPVVEKEKERNYKREVLEDAKPVIVDYDEGIEDEEEVASKIERKRGFTISEGDPHFEPYSLEKGDVNRYAAFLRDPQGLKDAFVMQEILNRKHF